MSDTRSVPRSPSDYRPSVHFGQQRRERDVPGEAIRECIENGEIEDHPGHEGYRLVAEWLHRTYWVAVIPEHGVVKSCGTID